MNWYIAKYEKDMDRIYLLGTSPTDAAAKLQKLLPNKGCPVTIIPALSESETGQKYRPYRFRRLNVLNVCKELRNITISNINKQVHTELAIMYDKMQDRFYVCSFWT